MSLAWTQTSAPTSRPPAVTEAAGILRATPLPTQSGEAGLAIGRRDMDIAAEPDDIVKAQFVEKGEQLDVAEAAIGQDRDNGALGQRLGEAEQTEVFIVVALSLQLALEDRQPQQRRRPAVVGERFSARVVWSSASKSVQSMATTMSGAGRPSRSPRGRTCPIQQRPDC